jgi:hypothetical protein
VLIPQCLGIFSLGRSRLSASLEATIPSDNWRITIGSSAAPRLTTSSSMTTMRLASRTRPGDHRRRGRHRDILRDNMPVWPAGTEGVRHRVYTLFPTPSGNREVLQRMFVGEAAGGCIGCWIYHAANRFNLLRADPAEGAGPPSGAAKTSLLKPRRGNAASAESGFRSTPVLGMR